jgi:hypothetical protein
VLRAVPKFVSFQKEVQKKQNLFKNSKTSPQQEHRKQEHSKTLQTHEKGRAGGQPLSIRGQTTQQPAGTIVQTKVPDTMAGLRHAALKPRDQNTSLVTSLIIQGQ